MGEFLKNMNLARWIILLTVPFGIGLAVYANGNTSVVEERDRALQKRIPDMLSRIQQLAIDHSQLSDELNAEGIKDLSAGSYIRKVATSRNVEIGDVRINESKRSPFTGIEDNIYTIRPSDSERGFQRVKVSNFLYKLEEDSNRVKVTDISMDIIQRRVKNHIVPNDSWTFTAQVTTRQAE